MYINGGDHCRKRKNSELDIKLKPKCIKRRKDQRAWNRIPAMLNSGNKVGIYCLITASSMIENYFVRWKENVNRSRLPGKLSFSFKWLCRFDFPRQ